MKELNLSERAQLLKGLYLRHNQCARTGANMKIELHPETVVGGKICWDTKGL